MTHQLAADHSVVSNENRPCYTQTDLVRKWPYQTGSLKYIAILM